MKRIIKLIFTIKYVLRGKDPGDCLIRVRNAHYLFEAMWDEIWTEKPPIPQQKLYQDVFSNSRNP
jgi:hypothetical protein